MQDEDNINPNRGMIIGKMRQLITQAKDFPRKPDPNVRRNLAHGWLFDYLIAIDAGTWNRWGYWSECIAMWTFERQLPDELIPFIGWQEQPNRQTMKMLEACLDAIADGGWRGWGSFNNFNYFLDWVLYGLGDWRVRELPPEPTKGASDRLYQIFCLDAMLVFPYDYFGDILSENRHGRHNGFFPTPLGICRMMAMMNFDKDEDQRLLTAYDGCLGTGRMLMAAGDYSLRLYGQDIDGTVIKAAMVNFYLYVPWAARPINFPKPIKPQAQISEPKDMFDWLKE